MSISELVGRGRANALFALPNTLAKARCRPSHENAVQHGGVSSWEGEVRMRSIEVLVGNVRVPTGLCAVEPN